MIYNPKRSFLGRERGKREARREASRYNGDVVDSEKRKDEDERGGKGARRKAAGGREGGIQRIGKQAGNGSSVMGREAV